MVNKNQMSYLLIHVPTLFVVDYKLYTVSLWLPQSLLGQHLVHVTTRDTLIGP